MTTTRLELTTRDGGTVEVSPSELDGLHRRLEGDVLRPGDDGWDEAITIWNAMVQTEPAIVVQPTSAADVAATVGFARDTGALLTIKCGGHNIAGTSVADGAVTIDMSRMRDVQVDAGVKLAHVGAGCRLADVDAATQEHGLATTLGFISKTGVAGLTLGGGFGYLARRFGWAVDNLEEVEIVTSDGEVRTANRDRHEDLFWAVRGGSGNFGVVTRFTFRLHEVGPMITGGLKIFGADRADEILDAYLDITAEAPRELTAALMIRLAPPAPFVPEEWRLKPVVGVLVCYTGDDPDTDLAAIRALGDPVVDMIGEHPYTVQQSMLDDMDPDGLCQYWKAEFLSELTDDYLQTWKDAALKQTSPLSFSVVFPLGGAINDRAHDDGAVGNRDARFITGFSGVWPPNEPASKHVTWIRESWEAIRPFGTGGNYVNFQLADDDDTRTRGAYGRNFKRLQEVKATYDPDNVFRANRNISPAEA